MSERTPHCESDALPTGTVDVVVAAGSSSVRWPRPKPPSPSSDGDLRFTATLADGRTLTARRVLVATGLRDVLPEVPGLAEHWGRGVVHCPYCHGWEVRDEPIGILATGAASAHHAWLFRRLTDDLVCFTRGTDLDPGRAPASPPATSASSRPTSRKSSATTEPSRASA
ncbi:hypothetical protein ACFV4N_37485 [Actinosynnema sp. NPDC059797]